MKTPLKFIAERGKYIEERKGTKLFKKVRERGVTKHSASGKNHKHIHKLSRGQLNSLKFLETKNIIIDGVPHIIE